MTDEERPPRVASHEDDPSAPPLDRLLLALGMWPNYIADLGLENVIDAAVIIRTNAHRLDFVIDDWGMERNMREEAISLLRELVDPDKCSYDHDGNCQAHSLDDRPCPHERTKSWLRSIDDEEEDEECPECGLPFGASRDETSPECNFCQAPISVDSRAGDE